MENVAVTLAQAQVAFLRLVSAETVLVGHGLENDLRALKITHTRCVDTSVLYAHPKGFPLRYKIRGGDPLASLRFFFSATLSSIIPKKSIIHIVHFITNKATFFPLFFIYYV
jgi:hypothetical protein